MIDQLINAMGQGIGTAIGLTLFEFYIKPRMHHTHEKIKKIIGGTHEYESINHKHQR